MMTHLSRIRTGCFAAIMGSFLATPMTAAEPLAGEWDPTITKHHGQYAQYGYFPTQWKTFPGSWSQMRPMVVAAPTTPEPPPSALKLPARTEADPMQSKTGLILPLDGPGLPGTVDSPPSTPPRNATAQ